MDAVPRIFAVIVRIGSGTVNLGDAAKRIGVITDDLRAAHANRAKQQHGRNARAVHASRTVKERALPIWHVGQKLNDVPDGGVVGEHREVALHQVVGELVFGGVTQLWIGDVVAKERHVDPADTRAMGKVARLRRTFEVAAQIEHVRHAIVLELACIAVIQVVGGARAHVAVPPRDATQRLISAQLAHVLTGGDIQNAQAVRA